MQEIHFLDFLTFSSLDFLPSEKVSKAFTTHVETSELTGKFFQKTNIS